MTASATDPERFRHVLGHFPTGVAVVTATHRDQGPAGMAVGSFTSVSLDPPLVAFLPDRSSTSFPTIRETGSFCVNVLADDQELICRAFATRGGDKYASVSWRAASSGSPILDAVVAWIDCDIESVTEAGDHYIVLGRVRELSVTDGRSPLLFFRGGYGRFFTESRSAPAEPDLLPALRVCDRAREETELIARELDVECLLVCRVGDDLVTLGSAGQSFGGKVDRIGQRMPFVPPLGALFVAADEPAALDAWLQRLGVDREPGTPARYREMVERVRDRGWSVALSTPAEIAFELALADWSADGPPDRQDAVHRTALQLGPHSHEPADDDLRAPALEIRNISAPVYGGDGSVALMLTLIGLPRPCGQAEFARYRERLLAGTRTISRKLSPAPSPGVEAADQPVAQGAVSGFIS